MIANASVSAEATFPRLLLFRIAGTSPAEFDAQRRALAEGLLDLPPGATVFGTGGLRHSFVAADRQEAAERVANARPSVAQVRQPNPVFVFSGLGGVLLQRFADFSALSNEFQSIIAQADRITQRRLGISVTDAAGLNARPAEDSSRLRRLFRPAHSAAVPATAVAHAVLYSVECALARTWMAWGVQPAFVTGYSLGEYAAAYTAGVFSFETGLHALIDRAAILAALPRTGLIAVGAGLAQLQPMVDPQLHLVAENSSTQTVFGGAPAVLADAAKRFTAAGHPVHDLPVEHAFHTPLMQQAGERLAAAFAAMEVSPPAIPLVSTLTGRQVTAQELGDPGHWVRHLCEPVRFLAALSTAENCGGNVFAEVGPGQSLSPLVTEHFHQRSDIVVVSSMPSDGDLRPATAHFLRTAGQLWEAGVPIDASVSAPRPTHPEATTHRAARANESATLTKLQAIWAVVLKRTSVDADQNLFDIGGNSLQAARIALRIKADLGADLSLRDIYEAPTPRQLGALVDAYSRKERHASTDLLTLPNGLQLKYQSRAEALYFYRSIFEERSYLRNGIRVDPGATVVDVGANIGMFSMFAALEAPGVRLLSVEPVPPLFDIMQFNLSGVCETFTPLNIGIAAACSDAEITYYPNSPGMSSFLADRSEEEAILEAILRDSHANGDELSGEILREKKEFMEIRFRAERFRCPVRTLSSVIEEHGLAQIDLLKIDVQKLESQVMQGISDRDWPRIRQLVVELHDRDNSMRDAQDLLKARGFAVSIEQDRSYHSTNIHNLYATQDRH